MKKMEALEKIETLNAVSQFHASTKGKDGGTNSKAFEGLVKIFLTGRVSSKTLVSAKGKTDLTIKGYTIEVKSGCGELDGISKNDFVIYSPDATLENARVFKTETFISIIEALHLIRTKKATSGKTVTAIQSFKNSQKKTKAFKELRVQYGVTLEEFKRLIEISDRKK